MPAPPVRSLATRRFDPDAALLTSDAGVPHTATELTARAFVRSRGYPADGEADGTAEEEEGLEKGEQGRVERGLTRSATIVRNQDVQETRSWHSD